SNRVISLNNPDDKAAGIPAAKTTNPAIQVTFRRSFLPSAVKAATITSNNENEDVRAAIRNKTKNNERKNSPKAIWSNTAGKTINSSPGPAAGSYPKAKTTGKMTSPAITETIIFMITTQPAL